MNASGTRVLIIDDEPDVARVLGKVVRACGPYEVDIRTSRFDLRQYFAATPPRVIFLDLVMPDMDGFDVIETVRQIDDAIPIIVISAHSSLENAVRAVKAGAFDFLAKPFDPENVELLLAKLDRAIGLLSREASSPDPFLGAILGTSPAIAALREWIVKVRRANTNVLIEGESGTGKELVARAIHGGRGPFVAINMAAVPLELAESELFGHRHGAFTGATQERAGMLLEAHGGTVFLDEVNAMPPVLQAKLLRVIQERKVRPVGGNKEIPVEFRVISAANEDLEAAVARGSFRRDLYHRLRVLRVALPPLRTRLEDIPLLADQFVQHYARAHDCPARRLAPGAVESLMCREWPGNVRELENMIEEAVILCPRDAVEIPLPGLAPETGAETAADGGMASLAVMERRYVASVLQRCGGNKAKAARVLQIDYKTLLRKLAEIDVAPQPARSTG